MKIIYFRLLIICCLLIGGGCSNYKELNGVAIVVAMGLDYLPKENKYIMIAQIINPSAIATQTGSKGIPVISVVEKGRTISEAARHSSKKNSRTNIYSHVALLALGENLVKKKSVKYIFDVFERDSKIRVNIPVIIARNNSVSEVLNTIPPLDKIPAKSIYGKIQNTSSLLGENRENAMREIISEISSKGREPTINGVSITNKKKISESTKNMENESPSYPFINGIGIFKDGKLVGWLDGPSAVAIQMIDNNIKETGIHVQCNNNSFNSIALTRIKTTVKIKMKNRRPSIQIKVKSIGHFNEVLCNDDLDNAKTLSTYEKSVEKVIKQLIIDGIKKVQQFGCDSFGFGNKYRLMDPKTFKKVEKNWNELFVTAKVKVNVDVQIDNVGMRKKAYLH